MRHAHKACKESRIFNLNWLIFALVTFMFVNYWYLMLPDGTWWYLMVPDCTWLYLIVHNNTLLYLIVLDCIWLMMMMMTDGDEENFVRSPGGGGRGVTIKQNISVIGIIESYPYSLHFSKIWKFSKSENLSKIWIFLKIWKFLKNLKMFRKSKIFPKLWKFFRKSENFLKIWKFLENLKIFQKLKIFRKTEIFLKI